MIKKLRRKFIFINLLIVCAILLAVFTAFCVSNYQRLRTESISAMQNALMRRGAGGPKLEVREKPPDRQFSNVLVFWVELAEDGFVGEIQGASVDITQETAQAIAQLALASPNHIGVLAEYNLRFFVDQAPDGTIKIAFADKSSEDTSMARVLLTSAGAFLAAMAAFFAVSIFLARWALRPVEQAWRQQQQFVADASHELKTPLTVILANTGILLSHRDDTVEHQAKWVENTKAEAERMKQLVNDLLFLAKADAARAAPARMEFSLSDAAWSTLLPFESIAFERGVTLEGDIVPDLFYMGDEKQLRQLIAILLDNACKYADTGGTITARLRCEAEKLVFSVRNTGQPIPREACARLFERFYRADESRARERGGYGLGLAIAKTIVEAHGGKVTVESGEGGTVFAVFFPRL